MTEFHQTRMAPALNLFRRGASSASSPAGVWAGRNKRGMTLSELLVVVFIISLMMAIAPPALTGVMSGRNFNGALDQVEAMVDLARSQAVSRDTYVWLGFENTTVDGVLSVRLMALKSRDGSFNAATDNLQSISRQTILRSTKLISVTSLPTALQARISADTGSATSLDLASVTSPQSFQSGGETYSPLIVFTPQGESLVPQSSTTLSTPFVPYILIGLRPAKGLQLVTSDPNCAALVINGGNSSQQSYRP